MNNNNDVTNSKSKEKNKFSTTEMVVIISIIAVGLILSILTYTLKLSVPPILVAVFMGIAVSAIVYRFLGGISPETAFSVGALKLGGSMAALIGCAWFINVELESQTLKNLDNLFEPHYREWFAIERNTKKPMTVKVADIGTLPAPKNEKLFVLEVDDEIINFVVTGRLRSEQKKNLDPLPFTIKTDTYDDDYSHYVLTDTSDKEIHDGCIPLRQTEIFQSGDKYYLVAVVEVNHSPKNGDPYAKFAIGEIPVRVKI